MPPTNSESGSSPAGGPWKWLVGADGLLECFGKEDSFVIPSECPNLSNAFIRTRARGGISSAPTQAYSGNCDYHRTALKFIILNMRLQVAN